MLDLGASWQGGRVVCHCDNSGAVAAINCGYSRVNPIMNLLRCLLSYLCIIQI